MYKITLFFESGEKGIYTKEEESADNEMWANIKKHRMIGRWLKILCPYIDREELILKLHEMQKLPDDIYNTIIIIIQKHLEVLNEIDNRCRNFNITVIKY